MSFLGKWDAVLFAAVLLAGASGCSPMDSNPGDEEKEPHYVLGKSRVNAFNYPGAIEAFEESLEANPHSAPAHYQLAMLFENQESDPAAAIYHYKQYLKYDPKAENAEVIQQHIDTCKQQLAADVLQLPSTPAAQQQIEKLTEENRRLHDQLAQWQAYYAAQQAAAKTNPPAPQIVYSAQPAPAQPQVSLTPEDVTPAQPVTSPAPVTAVVAPQYRVVAPKTFRPHTLVVASGDTLASIARKHGISLYALEAANPYVNPKKLKAGQVLNLPAP
jgi:LysM repeat protein